MVFCSAVELLCAVVNNGSVCTLCEWKCGSISAFNPDHLWPTVLFTDMHKDNNQPEMLSRGSVPKKSCFLAALSAHYELDQGFNGRVGGIQLQYWLEPSCSSEEFPSPATLCVRLKGSTTVIIWEMDYF